MTVFLADTNVVSELTRKLPDAGALRWLEAQSALVVSAITLEELSFGVARAQPQIRKRLLAWFEALLASGPVVVAVDDRVARAAGVLRAGAAGRGRVMSQADALIGASALVTGRTLVTRNVRDFDGCGVPLLDPFGA
ncbi:MAG: PIN domain-containing protein [Deltaproteobacteria bacterium]